ncbi:recombinase family protein [Cyanobacterium stanieri LEGE 03274]|uniref:Recombinase family protein n=1 Tax=Cyanobacterium stanieri LEGE 03274 TaxID=1828756 RepID=A0ABR9V4E2_9CHRO|nr:recombinase family protein [Cyanobacterium stanieri]MBE9222753.1 recombinase family protein [Cyanobacterium stanieri LEGE 03274]
MIQNNALWIEGNSCCGKTTTLATQLKKWLNTQNDIPPINPPLILSFNREKRINLQELIFSKIETLNCTIDIKTPSGFMINEVELFFPLIAQQLNIKSLFPIRLYPETEQELASQLWRESITPEIISLFGSESIFVRRLLDLLQLAGMAGIPPQEISNRLEKGQVFLVDNIDQDLWKKFDHLLLQWRQWCLDKGLLSYGIIYELYWRYLLPNSKYQQTLLNRYGAIFADDLDNFPAIMGDLFKFFLHHDYKCIFTYNNKGKVRLGLNADPDYLKTIANYCHQKSLTVNPAENMANNLESSLQNLIEDNIIDRDNYENIFSIKTRARAELITQVTTFILHHIQQNNINPADIAIIAPGLDEVARFNFLHFFQANNIPIEPLQEKRPLIASPLVRSQLTLLGLIFRGNGRLIERDMVAEMLTILSPHSITPWGLQPDIDPVRAGLLADYCYHIDIESPHLLPIDNIPSENPKHSSLQGRISYKTFIAYNHIRDWINQIKQEIKEKKLSPLAVIDKINQKYFNNIQSLTYIQINNLREFKQTANHFWLVKSRLEKNIPPHQFLTEFIILLRKGTITANPHPMNPLLKGKTNKGITLATIYQYRTSNQSHRWQFWLDASSNLWSKGGATELFASSLFLRGWQQKPSTIEYQESQEKQRIDRVIHDLLSRATDKIFLCHSDLDVNGNEQMGSLLSLVYLAPSADFINLN